MKLHAAHNPVHGSLALSILPAASSFGVAPSLSVVSTWGGPFNSVQVVGNLAYTGHGRELLILNISHPAAITRLGAIDLGSAVMSVAVQGNYAYVATYGGPYFFCVVSVANPAAPTLAWQSLWGGHFNQGMNQVVLHNGYAYVPNTTSSVDRYDIGATPSGSPSFPFYNGNMMGGTERMTIVGNLAYVMVDFGAPELRIYDLAGSPMNPSVIGAVLLASDYVVRAMATYGSHAYCLMLYDGIEDPLRHPSYIAIVDVHDPASPQLVGTDAVNFPAPRRPADIAIDEAGRLYIADGPVDAFPSHWTACKGLVGDL